MIRKKIAVILLTFGLVFTNVLFVNADETKRLINTKTETTKDAYVNLTKDEALLKKEELEASDGDETEFKITAVIRSYVVKTGEYEVKRETKVFDTKEEALAYVDNLTNDGFIVNDKLILQNSHTEQVELNQVFETEEDAKNALSDFIEKYNLNESDVSSKITKVYNSEKNGEKTLIEEGSTAYGTEAEALAEIKKVESETDDYIITGELVKTKKSTVYTEEVASSQFNTKKEAEDYIAALKKDGYDTSSLKINLVNFEESIWGDEVVVNPGSSDETTFQYGHFDVTLLSTFTKVDTQGNKTNVTGSMAISQVTIAGKNISMNLTSDPNRNDREYASTKRNSLNVTNKSLVKIKGTVTFEGKTLDFEVEGYLSEKQNACGGTGDSKGFDLKFESVTILENKVIVDTKLVTKYQVTGVKTKSVSSESYYVNTYKTIKGYDYAVTASAEINVLEDSYTLILFAQKEKTEEKYALDVTKETYVYEDIKGNLVVRYITIFDETLSPDETSTEKVGTDYKTEPKEFEYYKLVEVKGNETGKYIDGTTEVVYVYEFVGGSGGNDDPDFPVTGVETNNSLEYTLLISLISLISSIIIRRKLN
jgi:uncharacterized protein YfcZ (UPF0381/DUF406 family)